MEDDLITTKEVGDYRIKVYYCRDSECPITNWGLFGSFFFEYSDTHRLHDECNWKTFFYDNKHNLRDVIDAIVMKHIEQKDIVKYLKKGEANGISFTYNRGGNVWELKHKTSLYIGQEFFPSDLTDFDYKGELIEDLDDEDLLDIISKYGKDVVAIEWSTRGYSQGDYIKGIAYVTKEKYDNEVCDKEGDWKEDCAKIIDNEVKSIGMWMWGDVKGYVLEKKVKFVKKYEDESRENKEGENVWIEFIESEFGKPKEILRSFDFTVTKMAYYKEPKYEEKEDDYFPFSSASIVAYEYKLLYHEKFFEHLHMKRLVIDENIPFPVSTWERSYRYKGYGYNMCRETKKKLLQAIKGVNVEEEDVSLYTTGGWD